MSLFNDFCSFWSVAVNVMDKLQFLVCIKIYDIYVHRRTLTLAGVSSSELWRDRRCCAVFTTSVTGVTGQRQSSRGWRRWFWFWRGRQPAWWQKLEHWVFSWPIGGLRRSVDWWHGGACMASDAAYSQQGRQWDKSYNKIFVLYGRWDMSTS